MVPGRPRREIHEELSSGGVEGPVIGDGKDADGDLAARTIDHERHMAAQGRPTGGHRGDVEGRDWGAHGPGDRMGRRPDGLDEPIELWALDPGGGTELEVGRARRHDEDRHRVDADLADGGRGDRVQAVHLSNRHRGTLLAGLAGTMPAGTAYDGRGGCEPGSRVGDAAPEESATRGSR